MPPETTARNDTPAGKHKDEPHSAEPDPLDAAPLAYENLDFLNSPDGRGIRILSEYQEPMARFRRERIEDTVVFFGSARFRARDVAASELDLLENTDIRKPAPPDEQPASADERDRGETAARRLQLAEAAVEMARFYEDARTLARMMATWAKSLPGRRHRFVVTSGGGPGIMEAANRGAHEAGAKTIGLNIVLPFEQQPNPWITPALSLNFHYFFMRKFWFAYLAKALVVFPGGFGTLDEMFELLTLAQTRKLTKPMTVVIYGSAYWKSILNLDALVEHGAIARRDLDLFRFADTPEEAFTILRDELTRIHLEPYAGRPPGTDPTLSPAADATTSSASSEIPTQPAPSAQELLGSDISPTRRGQRP